MRTLLFKKKYEAPIIKGDKTQTVRLWKHGCLFAPGEVVTARCGFGNPGFARLKVTSIQEKFLDQITDEEAQADGYESTEALREALIDLYGSDAEHLGLYVVGFELVTS